MVHASRQASLHCRVEQKRRAEARKDDDLFAAKVRAKKAGADAKTAKAVTTGAARSRA